jgi:hypothetical protein
MKTITKKDEILRVDEETAELKIKTGWNYTTKKNWKENVRDINKIKTEKK